MDVGQTKTIEVDALADGDIGAWTVLPEDWTDPTGQSQYLAFSIPGGTAGANGLEAVVQSGGRFQLQVTLTADPSASMFGEADAVLVSTDQSQTEAHFWPFVVLTTAQANDAGVTTMRRTPLRTRRERNGGAAKRR